MASIRSPKQERKCSQLYWAKRSLEAELQPLSPSQTKRLKTTGEEFELRELCYFGDKIQTNDEVHSSIELCPVMRALVDTESFQRLRHIKQLGTSEYLYDCANGNRFQHSLGVAHLAERMCKTIKEGQPNLGATDKDVLCVKLAGLLHDLGHGPFSHIYETFRHRLLPQYLKANPDLEEHYEDCNDLVVPKGWSHEQSSLMMVDTALEELGLEIDLNNLDEPLKQIGNGVDTKSMRVLKPPGAADDVLTSRDFVFIKEAILGKALPEVVEKFGIECFIGREKPHQEWLYDIVNNRHSGLDVDKIDYFARDQGRTVGSGGIDYKLIEDARVARVRCCNSTEPCSKCNDNSGMHFMICYPRKRVETSMNFFKNRLFLHNIIYQHKKTVAAESLLCDILCSADPFFRLTSYEGKQFPISRAVLKSEFLLRLDDNVISLIEHSTQEELAKARDLCRSLRRHEFYKCAVDQPLDLDSALQTEQPFDFQSSRLRLLDDDEDDEERQKLVQNSRRDQMIWTGMSEHDIQEGILRVKHHWDQQAIDMSDADKIAPLEATDFIVTKYKLHHGRGSSNPLLSMRFFPEMNGKLIAENLDDLPVAEVIEECKYKSIIPLSFQKVGIRVFCRNDTKRSLASQFFYQWFESVGNAGPETTPDPHPNGAFGLEEASDDELDADDDNAGRTSAVMLSQESFNDDDDEEEEEHSNRSGHAHAKSDLSPVPVRSR